MTFDTLLVANRGEIAARVIRTARTLGLRTVAVYSDADRGTEHVRIADEAVRLGPAPAKESYLDADLVLKAAKDTGAGAIHPGYGFLSEDAAFARRCADAGIVFVGPTPEQLELFGTKHTARAAAEAAGVPLAPGTGLLPDVTAALAAADGIGYPVMLKATGGGGGIGMQACHDAAQLADAWERVQRVAAASFSSAGVFLERLVERARHVEVQVFGDGRGRVVTLGDRDCSLQRRNQKVLEEAPAPGLPDHVRHRLATAARDLCASVDYRSAGTVEFVYDAAREEAYFLEVNTRLQVEHPVTEAIYGVDLVAWMLRLAQGDTDVVTAPPAPTGHAVEARVYAEDPSRDHRPSAGLLTRVAFPDDVRVDAWVETGTEVTTSYDPMLAKVIAHGTDRTDALHRLDAALAATRVDGIETNLGLVRAALRNADVRAAVHSTATLAGVTDPTPRVEVVAAGTLTTVQDWPGRTGYWQVGVPPGGPMDDLSFRLGNTALGNDEGAPGLECTLQGPSLRFTHTDHRLRHRCPGTGDGRRCRRAAVGTGDRRRRTDPRRRRTHRPRSAHLRPVRGRPRRTGVPGQRGHVHPGPVRRARRAGPPPGRRPARRRGTHADLRRPRRRTAGLRRRLACRRGRRSARRPGVLHRGRRPRLLRGGLEGALQLGAHRRPAGRPQAALGALGRRRGRAAPLQHPRHAVFGGRRRLHR
ncbi:urea carboxylase [Streptomyces tendae]